MLLSTQTDVVFRTFGEAEGIEVLARAGYDAIDYSMFAMTREDCPLNTCDISAHAGNLRRKAEDAGLRFNQAHAPFPSWLFGNDEYNGYIIDRVIRSIRIAGLLGAKAIVVHPVAHPEGGDVQKEWNLAFYRRLEPIALEYGIKIALENMWGHDRNRGYIVPNVCSFGEDLSDYVDALNPEAFTVCLDLGHCGLVGDEADHAIRVLGKQRLGALHVHDNDYRNDTHTIPYACGCKMDWDKITRALGEIDYQGDFTYEADNFMVRCDKEAMPIAVRYMAELGRFLIARIDEARPGNQKK